MSEPVARVAVPAARAATEPPNEPPADAARFHGLRVTPQRRMCDNGMQQNSEVVVRAWRMPPAAWIRPRPTAVSPGRVRGAQQGAVGDQMSGQGLFLLRCDGQALQQPRASSGQMSPLGGGRGSQRLLEQLLGEGVDVRFDAFRACDDGSHQF
ncbi:hypothetical protein QMA61_36980 [Streptomyces coelicoflavus]|nr:MULTISPECIES: hypothetical protein [Streptomyces]MDI6521770.1 hypothetical protein [Streptomyces coelicoflavus]